MDEPTEDTTTSVDNSQSDGSVTASDDTTSSEVPSDIVVEPNLATTAGQIPQEEIVQEDPVNQEEIVNEKPKNNKTVTIVVVIGLLILVVCSLVAMLLLAQAA